MSIYRDMIDYEANVRSKLLDKTKNNENDQAAVGKQSILTSTADKGDGNNLHTSESSEALRSRTNSTEIVIGMPPTCLKDGALARRESHEIKDRRKEMGRNQEVHGFLQIDEVNRFEIASGSMQTASSISEWGEIRQNSQNNIGFNVSPSLQQNVNLSLSPNPRRESIVPAMRSIPSKEKCNEENSQESANSFDEDGDIVKSLLEASRHRSNPITSLPENTTAATESQNSKGEANGIDEQLVDMLSENIRDFDDFKAHYEFAIGSTKPDGQIEKDNTTSNYHDEKLVHNLKTNDVNDFSAQSENDDTTEKYNDGDLESDDVSHKNMSIPQHVEYHSRFDIEEKLRPDWRVDGLENNDNFDYKNCYGIIHVRILRAQRLSCPVNSDVHAIVSLPPWQGRIRSKTTKAFAGPEMAVASDEGDKTLLGSNINSGVCAVWEEDRVPPLSMLHDAMSSDADTAQTVPSVALELVFCPLGITFVELSMCSLTVSCRRLLQNPNVSIRQWFIADSSLDQTTSKTQQIQKKLETEEKQDSASQLLVTKSSSHDESVSISSVYLDEGNEYRHSSLYRLPLIEIEAMFEPLDLSDNKDDWIQDAQDELVVDDGIKKHVPEIISERGTKAIAYVQNDTSSMKVDDNTSHATRFSTGDTRDPQTPLSPKRSMNFRGSASLSGDNWSLSNQSFIKSEASKKQHLFRTITYWTPAVCCVCKRNIMIGLWRSKTFHCEECFIDCCMDCRLHVDLQLPCGSAVAAQARTEAIQSKLTVENIMTIVAPVVGVVGVDTKSLEISSLKLGANTNEVPLAPQISDVTPQAKSASSHDFAKLNSDGQKNLNRGIGVLKLNFLRAHVLKSAMPLETEPTVIVNLDGENAAKFRPGDYYIRITWTGSDKSARTQTVQSSGGRPKFRANEMHFTVKDYGAVFRIEIVDASTDKPLGMSVITTQSILQQQRDYLIEEKGIPYLYFLMQGPLKFTKLRRVILEMRVGLNDFEFFHPPKPQVAIPNDSKARPGDIVGCVEALVGFEEDLDSLYGSDPYCCPPRTGDELNMALFQVHIGRITSLLDDLKTTVEMYQFIVSWKNPFLTASSLCFFLRLIAVFDPAYIGSFPVFLGILWMISLAIRRSYGNLNQKFIQKEIESSRKTQDVTVDYSIHRPIGLIRVSVVAGKNMRSPELGLPGNVGCRVYFDPTRYLSPKKKEKIMTIDKAAKSVHDIGTTYYVYSINPEWDQIIPSFGMKRLRQLFPRDGIFFDSGAGDTLQEIDFPVLQPFKKIQDDIFCLEPWTKSGGGIVTEVKFNDVLSVIPGSEYAMGEVSIPLLDIVKKGKLSGWFPVIDNDTGVFGSQIRNMHQNGKGSVDSDSSVPQVFLKLAWLPPASKTESELETEKEASHVIQEEMVKAALMNQQQKLNIVGSSIGAFNTVRGLSGNLLLVQNTLGAALDILEQIVQVWSFTDPFKSSVVLGFLVFVWIVLSVVPTRLILLLAGLAQYGISFMARFQSPARKPGKSHTEPDNVQESPLVLWLMNGFRGLPTSDDLRKAFFWECRRAKAREMEAFFSHKRQHRMTHLWRVDWHGHVELLGLNKNGSQLDRQSAFALLQGQRFLWWRSINDFDEGGDPAGYLNLRGHAGLATPSPLEIRELNTDDLLHLVCIFGRGVDKQERVTLLTKSINSKIDLEKTVEETLTKKQN